jgi:EthD domain
MQKVVFVGYRPGEAAALTASDVLRINTRLLDELDGDLFPGIVLQTEDYQTTEQWLRRREPPDRRVTALLALWTQPETDIGDAARLVSDIWPDHDNVVVAETVVRCQSGGQTSATTPRSGRTVVSLMFRSPTMTRDECVRHWVEVHQPMSLRIHPQHTYVRNVVLDDPTSTGPEFDAISQEGLASVEDILEPERFFGADVSTSTWRENAVTIGDDVKLFLDRKKTTATVMFEYRLRDVPSGSGEQDPAQVVAERA